MNQHRLVSLEDLTLASLDPRALRERYGLPHPLSKFAANGAVKEGPYADAILQFIHDWTPEEPERAAHQAATWFLFQSEQAFFLVCLEAGIDAGKLRSHLQSCQQLGPDKMRKLLEERERRDRCEKQSFSSP
jgi:hypothetical protein